MSDEHKTLHEALCALQGEVRPLPKDGNNPHFRSKFTPLDTIVETVGPLLAKHGLTWSSFPCFGPNGEPALRYKLTHAATGDSESEVMPLLVQKSDPQGQGSGITYARRYSLSAVLNLVSDEDDDGNSATRRQAPKQAATPRSNGQLPPELAKSLADGYKATGWDQKLLAMHLTAVGAQDVSDVKAAVRSLTVPQARELLQAMSDAVDAKS